MFKLFKAGLTTAYSALNVLIPAKIVVEKRIEKRKNLSFIFFRDKETIKSLLITIIGQYINLCKLLKG